jgi:hypothetical protein
LRPCADTGEVPRRGPLLLAALWVAAAAVATAVGLLAVQLVVGQVSERGAGPLDARAVDDALTSSPPLASPSAGGPTPTPTPSASGSPRATSSPRTVVRGPVGTATTRGGVVSARCVDGDPRLVLATPAEGYRTKDSSGARVRFESSNDRVEVRVSCTAAQRVSFSVRAEQGDDEPSPTPHESEPSPAGEPLDDD